MTDVEYDPTDHLTEAAQAIEGEVLVIAHYIFASLLEVVLKAYESGEPTEITEKLCLEYVLIHPKDTTNQKGFLRIKSQESDQLPGQEKEALSVPIELLNSESVTRALIECRQRDQVLTDSREKDDSEYRLDLQEARTMYYETYNLKVSSGMWTETFKSLRRLEVNSHACAKDHLPRKIYSTMTRR